VAFARFPERLGKPVAFAVRSSSPDQEGGEESCTWCDDEDELSQRQQELRALAVDVTDVVDHGWCKSIYFKDPNHIQLEYCCYVGELDSSHVADRDSDAWMRVSKR
jgi:hypothetical protein